MLCASRDGDSSTDINAVCGVMERIPGTNTEEIPIYIEGGGGACRGNSSYSAGPFSPYPGRSPSLRLC